MASVARSDNSNILTGANTEPVRRAKNSVITKGVDKEERDRVRFLLSSGRKILGLKPIEKKHVEQMARRLEKVDGEKPQEKEERAKKGAVMMFLKWEMKMKQEDVDQIKIVKIFPPAREDWNILYVELATWQQAQFLLSFTSNMKRGTTGEDRLEVVR